MRDGDHVYCDKCWAIILDRGYIDRTELCDLCWWDDVGRAEVLGGHALADELLARVEV